jgi:hypothetical protein
MPDYPAPTSPSHAEIADSATADSFARSAPSASAGIVAFGETVSAVRVLFLSIIVVGILGLRLVEG